MRDCSDEYDVPFSSTINAMRLNIEGKERLIAALSNHIVTLEEALREISNWDLHSLCVDGKRAKNASESLANVRRFARGKGKGD